MMLKVIFQSSLGPANMYIPFESWLLVQNFKSLGLISNWASAPFMNCRTSGRRTESKAFFARSLSSSLYKGIPFIF